MNFSNELIEKAKAASSAEELIEMAKKEGVKLSAADAEMYFSFLAKGSQPLSDEELENVAGGKGSSSTGVNYPDPKYHKGQQLWIYYSSTHNYLGIKVVDKLDYLEGRGWEYLVLTEFGLTLNFYLDELGENEIFTYQP